MEITDILSDYVIDMINCYPTIYCLFTDLEVISL